MELIVRSPPLSFFLLQVGRTALLDEMIQFFHFPALLDEARRRDDKIIFPALLGDFFAFPEERPSVRLLLRFS